MSNVYILGAGASYSSSAPTWPLPLQAGFFSAVARYDEFQPMVGVQLQQDPMPQWLIRSGYGDSRGTFESDSRLFTDNSINLEELYAELEGDKNLSDIERLRLIEILDDAIFYAISFPIVSIRNDAAKTCQLHASLVKLLKPGDTIVSFNYDSLIDDALLYFSKLWHPLTGYGFAFDDVYGGAPPTKAPTYRSTVQLLKPHGSINFRYRDLLVLKRREIRYIGLHDGIQALTFAHMSGEWRPLIVPPSTQKSSHRNYLEQQTDQARVAISQALNLFIIGYSFPKTDSHAATMFSGFRGSLIVVNPHWKNLEYKKRVSSFGLPDYRGFDDIKQLLKSSPA